MAANGGLITKKDLAGYAAKERTPLRGRYKEFEIISMPPVSSGGTALIEMLNIVEPFDLKSKGLLTAPALHIQIEAMRRAYLDRARHLGDPDFVEVPVATLTSKEHAREVAASIDPAKSSRSTELGKDIVTVAGGRIRRDHALLRHRQGRNGGRHHDTLEGGYGSHVVVKGAGFLLNNEMGDFNKKPGETNTTGDIGTPANLIAPGKRMLSSMTPTMVVKDGKLVLVTGSPGGRTIINTVFTIVLGVVEYGLTGREAVDLRAHAPPVAAGQGDDRKAERDPRGSPREAEGDGPRHHCRGRQGDAHSIWISPDGTVYGIDEKRTADGKASVPPRLTSPAAGVSHGG